MTHFPELPYRFIMTTLFGMASIDFPATQWDVAVKAEVDGPGASVVDAYLSRHGIGFHGQLFTLDAVSPQDLHHALLMNQTIHHELEIVSFEVIGYVPQESPDAEDDTRWADEDDED